MRTWTLTAVKGKTLKWSLDWIRLYKKVLMKRGRNYLAGNDRRLQLVVLCTRMPQLLFQMNRLQHSIRLQNMKSIDDLMTQSVVKRQFISLIVYQVVSSVILSQSSLKIVSRSMGRMKRCSHCQMVSTQRCSKHKQDIINNYAYLPN